jgi:hypothetical protein
MLTTASSRRLTASAALPLPAAGERQRCYDFQCQAVVATFSGPHDAVVLGAPEEAEPGSSDG